MGVLEGKVVIVTGGAGSIGKACAELAAEHGAKLVVNDLGGSLQGEHADSSAAATVVKELRAKGADAVANTESIADYNAVRRMVEQALDTFGAVHAVISPAGILRDGMFHKMSTEDWHAVIDTHLHGAFNISRATIELFREQRDGAYVHFTSTGGLIGNVGQANYAAAKMGIVGLSRILAMEGTPRNVRSNVIAPFAWSRMIASIPVKDEASAQRVDKLRRFMRPDQVAQLAIALAAGQVSGQIFAARGNEVAVFSQPRPLRTVAKAEGWTPETLLQQGLKFLEASFTDLAPTVSSFPYDPM